MKNLHWASFNYLEFQLPIQAVQDCSHPGECYDDCAYWQRELELNLDRDKMISELKEYGYWSREELTATSNDELEMKLIWIAANDILDEIA